MHTPGMLPRHTLKLVPVLRRHRERLKKDTGHSGARFINKQENTHARLVFGGCKMSRCLHLPAKFYQFTQSQVHLTDGLTTASLSQGLVLEATSGNREGNWNPHSKDGRGDGKTDHPSPVHESTGGHVFLMTSSSTHAKLLFIVILSFCHLTSNA